MVSNMEENREQQQLIHFLKVLVELDLHFKVRAVEEGTNIKNTEIVEKELIEKFLDDLPLQYKKIPNYAEVVYTTLRKLQEKDRKNTSKDEKIKR